MPWVTVITEVRAYPIYEEETNIFEPVKQELDVFYEDELLHDVVVWVDLLNKKIRTVPPRPVSDMMSEFLLELYRKHSEKVIIDYHYKELFKNHKEFSFSVQPLSATIVDIH